MPAVRASLRAPAAPPRRTARLLHFAELVVGVAAAAFAVALLAVRFVIFPHVEDYRETLTSMLSRQLGQPVEIATIATGWDGWNPKIEIGGFRVRDSLAAGGAAALELPTVDLIVAWTSLPLLDLRLKQLVIERPRLAIRRDRAGLLHLAGIEFDPDAAAVQSPLLDWILRQPQIEVRDALILWNDDLRNAPQLVLDRVQFRVENRFGHHRFGIRGTPPPELAAPIDVRGDVSGASLKDWQQTQGRLYVRLDYADLAAWREWLPLPVPIASGQGALRFWFDFAQGEPRALTADLELADVRATLEPGLPELALDHLSGRAGWRYAAPERTFFARGLALVTADGRALAPADFELKLREAVGGSAPSGELSFDRMELAPLSQLAANLPLPERLRADIARFAPHGTLTKGVAQWHGPPDAPDTYLASAQFTDLAIAAQDPLPGLRGVSGSFTWTDAGGELRVDGRDAAVELPAVFASPLAFDRLHAETHWERGERGLDLRLERVEFANADAAGTASGTFRRGGAGPGTIDLDARLERMLPQQAHRYLPKWTPEATREWLRTAFGKGTVTDARLKLAGDLAAYPFADGKGGQFVVTAKTHDLTLDYDRDWPACTGLDADIRVSGARLTIDAVRGRIFGAEFGKVHAEIPDLRAAPARLRIDGEVSGPMAEFIRFIDTSPLAAWTGHVLEGAAATGGGRLALKLDIPLGGTAPTKVAGELALAGAELRLAGVPALTQVNGTIAFTETELHANDVAAEVFGGPARLTLNRAAGRFSVNGSGTANLATLRRDHPAPLVDRVAGNVDWTIAITERPEGLTWVVESPLAGAAIDLPAPLGKTAAETVPLRIERRFSRAQAAEDTIVGTYGRGAALAVHRKLTADGADVDRALLSLGRAAERVDAARTERPGLWIRAEMPALNVDPWLALQKREPTAAASATRDLVVEGVDLDVGLLEAFGRRFADLKVKARQARGDWLLDVAGRDIAGTATWTAPDAAAPNGRLVARLARLTAPQAGEFSLPEATDPRSEVAANSWPTVDVVADSFVSKGHALGKLEFVAQPKGAEWRIERLSLVNEAGRIDADGAWRAVARGQQTMLDVKVDVAEAGAFLSRFGYPDALQGAPTKIAGQLSWAGAPNEFDYPTLAGKLSVDAGAGRFTKVDPGVGKLLGVLSLQALPRRITLDFRDVFSEGFAFDRVTGDVRIQSGVMTTDNLKLAGPAAKVDIAGDADLAHETQHLTVVVQPALSMSVSAGAALLFLANPIIGAAVGAGSLLAQKVLQDPIERMFSYRYTVTGGWSDPVVVRSNPGATASVADAPVPVTR
jgi:uncharacterized protein (TIGR02099 family)